MRAFKRPDEMLEACSTHKILGVVAAVATYKETSGMNRGCDLRCSLCMAADTLAYTVSIQVVRAGMIEPRIARGFVPMTTVAGERGVGTIEFERFVFEIHCGYERLLVMALLA